MYYMYVCITHIMYSNKLTANLPDTVILTGNWTMKTCYIIAIVK